MKLGTNLSCLRRLGLCAMQIRPIGRSSGQYQKNLTLQGPRDGDEIIYTLTSSGVRQR